MAYTRLGTAIWDWKPWLLLKPRERILWLALYTSAEAKRVLPGLFHGGLSVMAESSRLAHPDVHESLSVLRDYGLVEMDKEARLTRLTRLPDRGERPANGSVLRMFWRRWCDLPESPVKEHHIPVIKWLIEPPTKDHMRIWDVTFGTVIVEDCGYVDNCGQSVQTSMILTGDDTVSDTVSDTVGLRYIDPSVRSRSSKRSSTTSGGGVGKGRQVGPTIPMPGDQPFTLAELLDTLREHAGDRVSVEVWDERRGEDLWSLVGQCGRQGISLDDVALVGDWLRVGGGLGYRKDLDVNWLAKPGNLISSVGLARQWDRAGRAPAEDDAVSSRKPRGLTAEELFSRAAQHKEQGR